MRSERRLWVTSGMLRSIVKLPLGSSKLTPTALRLRALINAIRPQTPDTPEDQVNPGKKIGTVVVNAHLPRDTACERILIGIELRPRGRQRVEEVGSIEIVHPGELRVGGVLPGDAQDVVQQRRDCCPLR